MKFLLLLLLVASSFTVSAQSFFKPVPPPQFHRLSLSSTGSSTVSDSSIMAFRPIVIAAAYALPGNILMAGTGISYQKLTWNSSTQKWYSNYSISAIGFAGGSVVPTTPAQIMSYGIMVGAFNNLILAGAALNSGKVQAVISIGISLNN